MWLMHISCCSNIWRPCPQPAEYSRTCVTIIVIAHVMYSYVDMNVHNCIDLPVTRYNVENKAQYSQVAFCFSRFGRFACFVIGSHLLSHFWTIQDNTTCTCMSIIIEYKEQHKFNTHRIFYRLTFDVVLVFVLEFLQVLVAWTMIPPNLRHLQRLEELVKTG